MPTELQILKGQIRILTEKLKDCEEAKNDLLRLAEHIALDPYALTPDQWASEARAVIAKATEVQS